MKYEWKKQEKELYEARVSPAFVTVPAQKYIMISGSGNPNDIDFSNRVSVLYSLAYTVKAAYKTSAAHKEIHDFTVYPLEGIWQAIEEAQLVKAHLSYTLMIRQPDFICADMVTTALQQVRMKKPSPLYDEVRFQTMQDGTCVQILHIGAFDEEPVSFAKMEQFLSAHHLRRAKSYHREIYLNNAKRVDRSKLKTILRYCVE